jgi:hypothetical protein
MVTISGFTERQSADGKKFYALILQGGMELVLSEASGRFYATQKQTSITSTLDEKTCQGLVGSKLPGRILKQPCEVFNYTIQETGEVISINHRWVYSPSEAPQDELIYDQEPVGTIMAH